MATFRVTVREVHSQDYLVVATDEAHARLQVEAAGGELVSNSLEYVETLAEGETYTCPEWEVVSVD